MSAVCLLSVALFAPAQPPQDTKPEVWKGIVKDVRGGDGILVCSALKAAKDEKPKQFNIVGARFVGENNAELKVGDLKPGDQVELTFTKDGKAVQEVRVVRKAKPPG